VAVSHCYSLPLVILGVGWFTTPQLFQRGRNWGKMEWEAGFQRWWEMGEIGKKLLLNIV